MRKNKKAEIRTTPTTTLVVTKLTDFSLLEANYKLIRYILPSDLRYRAKRNKNVYGQMHNCLRDQLNCPYKAFMYEQIGDTKKWVVYALYLRQEEPADIKITFVSDIVLEKEEVPFERLKLHILLKLLQIAYIHGERATRFIGQDYCYVYAKKDSKDEYAHVCLRIDLKGDINNQEEDVKQEFKVLGQACLFKRVEYPGGPSYNFPYFGGKITQNQKYFLHLKRNEIENHKKENQPLYGIRTREGKRTTLDYHDQYHIEASRGKLLFDFIRDFKVFLEKYGVICRVKERHFTMFTPLSEDQTSLPLSRLNPIKVFDNRLNRKQTLQEYLDVFKHIFNEQNILFVEVMDLSQIHNEPVLVPLLTNLPPVVLY